MSKGKIMALIGLITLALGVTAIDNTVADEARNEATIEGNSMKSGIRGIWM